MAETITIKEKNIHSILLGDDSYLVQMKDGEESVDVPYSRQTVSKLVELAQNSDILIVPFGE